MSPMLLSSFLKGSVEFQTCYPVTLRALFWSVKFQIYVFHQSKDFEALCNSSETFSSTHKKPPYTTDYAGIILNVISNTANNFFQNHWLVEGPKCSLPDGYATVDFSLRLALRTCEKGRFLGPNVHM